MTRRSLAWVSSPIEEISSKKMVPVSAASNKPCFSLTAPVKAPLTWPKRWLSRGHELLARPALALDEDGRARRGGRPDELEDRLHDLASADDGAEAELPLELAAEADVLVLQPLVVQSPFDGHQQLVMFERLLDVVESPVFHGLDGRFDRGIGRDDDDLGAGVDAPDGLQDLDALQPGHQQIEEEHVEGAPVELGQPLFAAGGQFDLVALRRQELAEDVVDDGLVVDDMDCSA